MEGRGVRVPFRVIARAITPCRTLLILLAAASCAIALPASAQGGTPSTPLAAAVTPGSAARTPLSAAGRPGSAAGMPDGSTVAPGSAAGAAGRDAAAVYEEPIDWQHIDPEARNKMLAGMIKDLLTDLAQLVSMPERIAAWPDFPPARQLAGLIRTSAPASLVRNADVLYEQYLIFDEKILAALAVRDPTLRPVVAALRRKYVELAALEIEGWTPESVVERAEARDLEALSKKLAASRGDDVEGASEIRERLEQKLESFQNDDASGEDLREIQGEIARHRTLRAGDFDFALRLRFHLLARRYLAAFGRWMKRSADSRGGVTIDSADPLLDRARERIARHRRGWHPFFALALLREVFIAGPDGAYALMLGRTPEERRERIRLYREAQLAGQRVSEDEKTREAEQFVDSEARREKEALWEMLGRSILDPAPEILTESAELGVDVLERPVRVGVDPYDTIHSIVELACSEPRNARLRDRLRSREGSLLLAPAVQRAVESVLHDDGINGYLRIAKLRQLSDVLVILQTPESETSLMRLFEFSDRFAYASDVRSVLTQRLVEFIERSLGPVGDRSLGFDLIEQLMLALGGDVQVEAGGPAGPVLSDEKVLGVFTLLEGRLPRSMELYVRWTIGGDQSALSPMGCEAVVFHLADLLIDYARAGRYLRRDIDVLTGNRPEGEQGPLPIHEQVMATLRWINGAMGSVAEIPRVNYEDLQREQRKTLEKLFEGFDGPLEDRNPRYIETLLQIAKRLAHSADASAIKRRIYEPFASALRKELALVAAKRRREPILPTPDMTDSLIMMWMIIGERGSPFDERHGFPTMR